MIGLGLPARAWGVAVVNQVQRGTALQERAAMGRVTRRPAKPTPKYLHEVTVRHSETGQA